MKFELTEPQIENLNLWLDKIKKKHGKRGLITYCFTPTGIGSDIKVYSTLKKKPLILTDIENY